MATLGPFESLAGRIEQVPLGGCTLREIEADASADRAEAVPLASLAQPGALFD